LSRAPEPRRSLDLVPAVQALVCEVLETTGDLGKAARAAGTTLSAIRAAAARDPSFSEALELAVTNWKDSVLIPEAARRAVEGAEKGVYYQGKQVLDEEGKPVVERVYSDGLMLRLLEVLDPRFRPHSVTERRDAPTAAAIDNLLPEQRRRFDAFVESLHLAPPTSPPAAGDAPQPPREIAPDPEEPAP